MCFNQLKCFSLSFRFNELIAAHVKITFELFNRSTRNTTQDRRGWGGGSDREVEQSSVGEIDPYGHSTTHLFLMNNILELWYVLSKIVRHKSSSTIINIEILVHCKLDPRHA